MKNKLILLLTVVFIFVVSCSPSEEKASLPQPIAKTALDFKVSQKDGKDNVVYLHSLTSGVIPYWNFGSGISRRVNDTVIFPFSGDYAIHYGVSSGGGFVEGDSVTIHVTTTDLSYLTDSSWAYLTNGQMGKTWVLDMSKPIGWYGYDYLKHNGSADDWSWHPDYKGNEWVMPDRDYGEMTFNLDNGKNYKRVYIDDNGNRETCTGKFDMNITDHTITLVGCEMLFGGNYHSQVSDWSSLVILALTDSSMTLAVNRDHPNPPDGPCWIGFTFKVKE